MRIDDPVPVSPLACSTTTPGVRLVSMSEKSVSDACGIESAWTTAMLAPVSRRDVASDVAVLTIALSVWAKRASEKFATVGAPVPTTTCSVSVLYPSRIARTSIAPAGTFSSRKWPSSDVRTTCPVPTTITCAWPTGCCRSLSDT
jgi:hypothetical protein